MKTLADFRTSLDRPDALAFLRDGLIGNDVEFDTPHGTQRLLYADYVASGRALRQVEDFVAETVLPFYANTHSESSFCGAATTHLREEARAVIARLANADARCHVIFTGSGATAGFNRIVNLLRISERIAAGERIVVLIGPYEHHSNILPWRESKAQVLTMPEAGNGGVDLGALEAALKRHSDADLIVGSFSAASNVSGILTDPDPVTRLLKRHGALAIWDYAGGGPYLDMNMAPSPDCMKDAIVFSAHKFPGGPGASGVMIIRDTIVQRETPTAPGGGTVSFVSPWRHAYSRHVEEREEGGTPNIIGDIRAGLVMLVKDAIGTKTILARDEELRRMALRRWGSHPNLQLLGQRPEVDALPIFSFLVRDTEHRLINPATFTRALSDRYGIQARGGCSCAGPYGHVLLDIDMEESEALFARIAQDPSTPKPGWARLNLSYMHSDEQISRILEGVTELAAAPNRFSRPRSEDRIAAAG
jgi:selenocysteine lyase/cysteine desulfurase